MLYHRVAHISAQRFTPILEDLLVEASREGKVEIPHPHEAAESLLVLFDLTSRQLCAKTDHARRVRVFETFRFLLAHILSEECVPCLLYTSDAADERSSVDLGGRCIIKKKKLDHTLRHDFTIISRIREYAKSHISTK